MSADTPVADAPIRVQLSLRPPDGTTQFVDLLVPGMPQEIELRYFRWRRVLLERYDVLHVHWPELMIRDSRSRVRAFVKRRLLDATILRLRLLRVPIVRTFHNPRPHERGSAAEQRSLDRFDRATTMFLALDDNVRPSTDAATVVIPHGHYVEAFRDRPHPPSVSGRLLYFGIIRPYKNVETLVRAFAALDDPSATLHVVGDPHPGQRAGLEAAARADDRVEVDLRFVDDETLAREVGEAQLIVLPYVEMKNSGALLVALSLGRPALVPRSPINDALAEEVGAEWVRTYEGDLTTELLRTHLAAVSADGWMPEPPRLSGRDAATIGAAHAAAYRRAIALRARS